jgi:hypothetical protein
MAAAKQIEGELARRDGILHARLLARAMDDFIRYGSDCLMLCDPRGRVVRTSGSVQAAREHHGVRLPFEVGAQLVALNLGLAGRPPAGPAAWLRPEWLHPVKDGETVLGTLLVIPLGAGGYRAPSSARAAVGDGATDAFAEIIGESEVLQASKARARRIAPLDLPVLLLGETGAGKELFARALHGAGGGPVVPSWPSIVVP